MGFLSALGINNGAKVSSTASAMTDARMVLGEGAASNTGAGSLTVFNTSNTTTTDLGAIARASEISKRSAELGAQVALNSMSGALNFGSDALGLSADAIGANQKALTNALDFGGNAMDYASGAFDDALGFGGNAMDYASGAFDDALGFGRTAMTNTADAWGNAYASADASRNSAFSLVDSVVGNSVSLLEDQFNKSRTDSASLVDKVLGQVQGATNMLGNAYADSQGRGALTDKMLMVAIGGAVLIAVAAVWRK